MVGEAEGAVMARVEGMADSAKEEGTAGDAKVEVDGRAADAEMMEVGRWSRASGTNREARDVASEDWNSMWSFAQSTNRLWWHNQCNPMTAETLELSRVTRNVIGRVLEEEK